MDFPKFLKDAGRALELEADRISREAEGGGLDKINASQLKDYLHAAEIFERLRGKLADKHAVDQLSDEEVQRQVREHLTEAKSGKS
tara:strand:- start:26 stop:283 length:258 start_codon:yes stop_codon:yes gene_type:complete